jgi:hypothetical protein
LPPCSPGSTGDPGGASTVASNAGDAVQQAAGGAVGAASASGVGTASPAMDARLSAVAPGAASVGNPCAGRQHCYKAGPFAAEVQLSAANQRAGVAVTLRNVTNQPIFVAYKGTTSQLRDNLGHALSLQQDPSGYQRPFRLNPGQALPLSFAFNGGQNPLGTSFTYAVVIDQLQVLPTGQAQLLREYPLSFPGLTTPGAVTPATATRTAASTAAPAVKRPAPTTVAKKP